MTTPKTRTALIVDRPDKAQKASCRIESVPFEPGPDFNQVVVRITHSSINYKDALCCTGHSGVARNLPMIPGIDAAGVVVSAPVGSGFADDDPVMIFNAKFGTECDGAYTDYTSVPAEWVFAIPDGLDAISAMTLGTAGFTAAHCTEQLIRHDVRPESGPIIVSGATGGVGIFSVLLLSRLGYEVHAATGKQDKADWLRSLGAEKVVPRAELDDRSDRPLLKSTWAGAVDTVGGNTLATVVRGTKIGGCVTACGVAGGNELPLTVYPFILRGVTLQGIDSANCDREFRARLWHRLATEWKLPNLDELRQVIGLSAVPEKVSQMLAGQHSGRTVIDIIDGKRDGT